MKLAVIGQGYVGLPLAIRAVEAGFVVVGVDSNHDRVAQLNAGISFTDDVPSESLSMARTSSRYVATSNYSEVSGFDVAVITVPTPLIEGKPDLSFIELASAQVGEHVTTGCLVILESTTYPGTTEELVAPILERCSGLKAGKDFHLGYSPERIDPGNQTFNFRNTPKVISGVSEPSLKMVDDFYSKLVDSVVRVKGTREAEMTKLLENTFRHVNIAMINELATHAAALKVDIWEAVRAASTKPFGFMPFWPGPGVGGHCLPIDPTYLSWKIDQVAGIPSQFIEAANKVNESMPDYVVRRIQASFAMRDSEIPGSKMLVVGLAYKKNSNDIRETPAVPIISKLLALGADVEVLDPHVGNVQAPPNCKLIKNLSPASQHYDVAVIVTDHDEIDYAQLLKVSNFVFDTRGRLAGHNVELL